MAESKVVRCAIYTRVSTDAGLEQDFNSLDAQREAAEAYIKSQSHEGWRLIPTAYDDGGYSGGNVERPALCRLLQDIRDRKIDVIVVYKVDRLTRSLADFAKLVELFDQHSVSFVSVTQAFNTTTSMGRLTLNVLLSFAQFEREVTAERIRDKVAASKKKGIWVGGNVPFGYRVENRKLVIDPDEAKIVQLIFQRYLELGSIVSLSAELYQSGIRTRKRRLSTGAEIGGVPFATGPLLFLLRNCVYVGELKHHEKRYRGEHLPIIKRELFDAVQAGITNNARRAREVHVASGALLMDLLFDDRGNKMTPTYSMKGGMRYRYYVCRLLGQGRRDEAGSVRRVAAGNIEPAVINAIREFSAEKEHSPSAASPGDPAFVRSYVERIIIEVNCLRLFLKASEGDPQRQIEIPWVSKRGRPRREMLLPHKDPGKDSRPIKSEVRVGVVKAVAKSRAWLAELAADKALTMESLALREGRSKRSVYMLLSLNFLAPDIVQALIAGKLPRGVGITKLVNLPSNWHRQREVLGLEPAS